MTTLPLTEATAMALAARRKVPVETICLVCARQAFTAYHHGHKVSRIRRPDLDDTTPVGTSGNRRGLEALVGRPTAISVPEMLTVTQVAVALAVSKMTVYRLVDNGDLAAVRVGRNIRIAAPVLATYLSAAVITPGTLGESA